MKLKSIHSKLFLEYGNNARIWLFVYYDEYDISNGNWICRTSWTNPVGYKINWTQDYYTRRMSRMNEEISQNER